MRRDRISLIPFAALGRAALLCALLVAASAELAQAQTPPNTTYSVLASQAQAGVYIPAPAFGNENGEFAPYYLPDPFAPPIFFIPGPIVETVNGQSVSTGIYSFTFMPTTLGRIYTTTFEISLLNQGGLLQPPQTWSFSLVADIASISGPSSMVEGDSLSFLITPRATGMFRLFLKDADQPIGSANPHYLSPEVNVTSLDPFIITTPPITRTSFSTRTNGSLGFSNPPTLWTGPMPTRLTASAGLGFNAVAFDNFPVTPAINVIPEPAGLGVAGLLVVGAIALYRHRRALRR